MIITFVRHMETTWNEQGILQGSTDTELSPKGLLQCMDFLDATDFSDVDVIYSSALHRAKYLAEKIAQKEQKKLIVDQRLNEISIGDWEGLTWKEVTLQYEDFLKEWYNDNVNTPAPKGESYQQFQDRLLSVIDEIKEQDYHQVLIVSHGAATRTMLSGLLNIPLKNRGIFELNNGVIVRVEVKQYKAKLLELNNNIIKS